MIDRISNKILLFLSNDKSTKEEKEILLFGITRIVEDIPKYLGIIIIGIILGILKEMAIVTLVTALYKTFTGGVHAKTNLGCFIHSLVFYLSTIYLSKYVIFYGEYRFLVYLLIYIFSIYTILVYVPADVKEIPKVDLKLRKSLKIKAYIMLNIIYLATIIFIKDIQMVNLIIYSVLYISIMTTRSIYKILKTEYGFETYIKES